MLLKSQFTRFNQYFPFWELLGVLVLLWPAFANGFPILNPDAAANIMSGILWEHLADRPIGYGVLMRFLSLNLLSLRIATVFQVIFVVIAFFYICRQILPGIAKAKVFLLLLFLCLTTGLPWIATLIIPDIYTTLSFLLVLGILMASKPPVGLYILFFISTTTHASQIQVMLGLLVAFTLLRRFLFRDTAPKIFWLRTGLLTLLVGGALLTMMPTIRQSKHVFFIASMMNRGILKPFLDKSCPTEHFELCTSKAQLAGKNGDWFLWESESPLTAGGHSWYSRREDYNRIINASFADGEYRWLQVQTMLEAGCRQITDYRFINYNRPFSPGEGIYNVVMVHFPKDFWAMTHAYQQTGTITPVGDFVNVLQSITVPLSVAFLLVSFVAGPLRRNRRVLAFTVASVLLILGNDFVCAAFSGVNSRYGARVIWLMPMSAGLALLSQTKTQPKPTGSLKRGFS